MNKEIKEISMHELLCSVRSLAGEYQSAASHDARTTIVHTLRNLFWGRPFDIVRKSNPDVSNSKDDIVFITPPYWDVFTPFSAVPCLVAALKQAGRSSRDIDLGIMSFRMLSRDDLRPAINQVLSPSYFSGHISCFKDNDLNYEEYTRKLSFLSEENTCAMSLADTFSQLDPFQREIVSRVFMTSINRLASKISLFNPGSLQTLVEDTHISPITKAIAFYDLVPYFLQLPKVAGVSITSLQQVVSGCFLALLLKAFKPDIRLAVGGSSLEIIKLASPSLLEQMLAYFDFACVGEGESFIVTLLEHIDENETNKNSIPNLVTSDNGVITTTSEFIENVEDLSPPFYSASNLSLYLVPMLSYQTSRGCFYGNCAFCNHCERYRKNYRPKSPAKVVGEVKSLLETYLVNNIQFTDEAIEPLHLNDILDQMEKENLPDAFSWLFYSRVSKKYSPEFAAKIKSNGCKMIMFGIETFSQNVLNSIRKGISAKTALENLQFFSAAGIKTFAWFMTLLPGQTREDVLHDMNTIQENATYLTGMSFNKFILSPETDMIRNPQDFGIVVNENNNGYNFSSYDKYGNIIDTSSIEYFLKNEFHPMLRRLFFTKNRYIIFFNNDIMQ